MAWKPQLCTQCEAHPTKTSRHRKCWRCLHPDTPAPPCRVCGEGKYWTTGYCKNCHPRAEQRSCIDCYTWGPTRRPDRGTRTFGGPICEACSSWHFRYTYVAPCRYCGRTKPLRETACRLCWVEARRRVRPGDDGPILNNLTKNPTHQLWFNAMGRKVQFRDADAQRPALQPPDRWSRPTHYQLNLFEVRHDLPRPSLTKRANAEDPRILAARTIARRLAAEHGWSAELTQGVNRGLIAVLSGQLDDAHQIPYSAISNIVDRHTSVERLAEVLGEMDLLHDDRPDTLNLWLDHQLAELNSQVRAEIMHWVAHLRGELPRSMPRPAATIQNTVAYTLPALTTWSTRYNSLREVQRQDIKDAVFAGDQTLDKRRHVLSAHRSLFGRLKRDRLIFRNPVTHISLPTPDRSTNIGLPLRDSDLQRVWCWSEGHPPRRLLLVLAAVQALKIAQMRRLLLDDIDLGDRVMKVGTRLRPIDSITYDALVSYLAYRRNRWPATTNPHLLISQQTALEVGPVSASWNKLLFKSAGITLTRLREDRLLEELLARGPDPLHFQTVFNCSQDTAIAYAKAVERIIQDPPSHRTP